jgi:hypothetical protein
MGLLYLYRTDKVEKDGEEEEEEEAQDKEKE